MKKFLIENKKSLLIFFSSIIIAFLLAGGILYMNHKKELEKTKTELKEQKEKRKEEKEKKKQQEKTKPKQVEEQEMIDGENKENQNKNSIDSSNLNKDSNSSVEQIPKTENDVIAYFEEQERYASGNEQDASLRESLKNGVSTIYQFLFQGGTIHGKTFNELSSSAKLKVLKIALSIDSKIDSHFPNYKQTIKQKASSFKSKIIITYLETTNKICNNYESVCTQAREDFKKMKESFKISFSLIAGLVKEGGVAIKEWYLSTK